MRARGAGAHLAQRLGKQQSHPSRHQPGGHLPVELGKAGGRGRAGNPGRRLFLGCGYCAANTPIPLAVLEASQEAEDKAARRRVGQALSGCTGWGCWRRARAGRRSTRCWPSTPACWTGSRNTPGWWAWRTVWRGQQMLPMKAGCRRIFAAAGAPGGRCPAG